MNRIRALLRKIEIKKVYTKKNNVLLLLLLVAFSTYGCKKNEPVPSDNTPVVTGNDPDQYNIPFNNVPDPRDVSIYQVNIRTFSKEGNLKGVQARLDSIKALGINVIYLMPIYPVGVLKSVNSPYCVKDYKSVNSEFGTLNDLRALIDEAHKKDMAVILDWVANHTSFDNSWTSNKSWYQQDSQGNIVSPPGWNDVAQLNFGNADMRLAMIKAMKYWVYAANIDGFRCDYADGPPVDFWKQAIDTLRKISTHKLLLLAEGKRSANYTVGFDYNFGFSFFEKLKTIYNNNQSVQLIDNLNASGYTNASDRQQVVRYITNHDVNSSDGTPLELFGGKSGSMAAFVVTAYMKSVPMIYNGQEVGTPFRLTFPFTTTKIDWSLNPGITAEYKKVLAVRNNSEAIRRGQLISYSSADVCAFSKEAGTEKVFVASNLRNKSITYTVPSNLANTVWTDAFSGKKVTLKATLILEPYSYIVLKN
ncbi:alpha-amylase family glycosyl hydrolase [Rubrolithibacter danxiaensis]|uniref:alpha-amylase family glycosyl hydrolase n=1 Tax=Rubrolithibacter danxiaensis TaxID=3390805 RepID=UPI003BF7B5AA